MLADMKAHVLADEAVARASHATIEQAPPPAPARFASSLSCAFALVASFFSSVASVARWIAGCVARC
jgi:hypothetical protein